MAPTNILLIYPDQHRFDCTSINGHPFVKTPTLDRLASQGVNFGQAYCPIPLCVPTRNTLLHGQWPIQHQCICNDGSEAPRPPEPGLPTFIEPLREAGYYMGYVGKWHVNQFRGPLDYGFDEYIPDCAYTTWRTGQGLPPHPFEYAWFGKRDPHIGPEQSRLAWGADQTLRLLARIAEEDRPFVSPDGLKLWFDSSSRQGHPGPAIFRATRQPDGTWGQPEEIVSSFAAEPTLSGNGDTLYFAHHFFTADLGEMIEADIYVSSRLE